MTIFTPANKQDIIIEFNPEKMARAVGRLAAEGAVEGRPLSGVVVRKEYATKTHLVWSLFMLLPSTYILFVA